MASARTETERTRYLREFLGWWKQSLLGDNFGRVYRSTSKEMILGQWTPDEIIKERRKTGFADHEHEAWRWLFLQWKEGRFKRRALIAARASWTDEARKIRLKNSLVKKSKRKK